MLNVVILVVIFDSFMLLWMLYTKYVCSNDQISDHDDDDHVKFHGVSIMYVPMHYHFGHDAETTNKI